VVAAVLVAAAVVVVVSLSRQDEALSAISDHGK
jgi:hypothetical protein